MFYVVSAAEMATPDEAPEWQVGGSLAAVDSFSSSLTRVLQGGTDAAVAVEAPGVVAATTTDLISSSPAPRLAKRAAVPATSIVSRKFFRNQKELDEFSKQQYDFRAFSSNQVHGELEWNILKLSSDVDSFYRSLATSNRSEPLTRRPPSPLSYAPRPSFRAQSPSQSSSSSPRVRGVLVVEDSSAQMKLICRSLSVIGSRLKEKWIFFEASTGEVALKMLSKLAVDLVFVDQNLATGGITGDRVLTEIRRSGAVSDDQSVPATTAGNKKKLLVGVISNPTGIGVLASAGADLIYVKPFSVSDECVASLCGAIRSIEIL